MSVCVRASFSTLFRFLLIDSLGLRPIDMEKTGLILIVVRRCIGPGVKAKKKINKGKRVKEKRYERRQ